MSRTTSPDFASSNTMSFITSSGGSNPDMYPRFMDYPGEEDLVPMIVSYINKMAAAGDNTKARPSGKMSGARTTMDNTESPDAFLYMEDPLAHVNVSRSDWQVTVNAMIDLHLRSNLTLESLFCAVHMLGRLLKNPPTGANALPLRNRQGVMMTGFVCLWSAAKVEETMWEPVYGRPSLRDLVDLGSGHFNKNDIRSLECKILAALEWNISPPNCYTYLLMALQAGFANEGDRKVRVTARYLAELSLFDPRLLMQVEPSRVAAACLYLSMRMNRVKSNRYQARQQQNFPCPDNCTDAGVWTKAMSIFTNNANERSILPVVNVLRVVACDAFSLPTHAAKPVQERYAGRHYEFVAMTQPPTADFVATRQQEPVASSFHATASTLDEGMQGVNVVPPHATKLMRATPLSSGQALVSATTSGSSTTAADAQTFLQHAHQIYNAQALSGASSSASLATKDIPLTDELRLLQERIRNINVEFGASSVATSEASSAQVSRREQPPMQSQDFAADFLKRMQEPVSGAAELARQQANGAPSSSSSHAQMHPELAQKMNADLARRLMAQSSSASSEDDLRQDSVASAAPADLLSAQEALASHQSKFSSMMAERQQEEQELSRLQNWLHRISGPSASSSEELPEESSGVSANANMMLNAMRKQQQPSVASLSAPVQPRISSASSQQTARSSYSQQSQRPTGTVIRQSVSTAVPATSAVQQQHITAARRYSTSSTSSVTSASSQATARMVAGASLRSGATAVPPPNATSSSTNRRLVAPTTSNSSTSSRSGSVGRSSGMRSAVPVPAVQKATRAVPIGSSAVSNSLAASDAFHLAPTHQLPPLDASESAYQSAVNKVAGIKSGAAHQQMLHLNVNAGSNLGARLVSADNASRNVQAKRTFF